MGRTENRKMPDFGNQPPRGLSGGLDGLNNPVAQSINYFDKLDPKAPLAIFNFRIRPSGLCANFTVI